MTHLITLIGTVGGDISPYNEQDISVLLNSQQTELLHNSTFTGRPGTLIHSGDNAVLKVRSEIRLELSLAKRWAVQALDKEKHYQVHHPHKTWFVADIANQSYALIGNICPRLQPLHQLFAQAEVDISTRLQYLGRLFDHYFRLAQNTKMRLDEGLSNFGVSPEAELYYLDDDIYSWDRFVSCAQMLGVYFRSLPWLTSEEVAGAFGQAIHQLILEHFQDAQYFTVLAEQLRDVYLPAKPRQAVDYFIKTLNRQPQQNISYLSKHRYVAILADIHANLPALRIVLDFLKLRNIQQGIVLGDIVGYGPHPNQCIERLQDSELLIIKGNHDHGLATNNFSKGFSTTAAWVLEWSSKRVSTEQKTWLADLPPLLHTEQWLAVHGAPIDPTFFNAYVYEMTYHDNLSVLQRKHIPLCFHGHTHQPGMYAQKKFADAFHEPQEEIDLSVFTHALVCPGSIGQPRNGKLGAQFAIYDQIDQKLYFHTLPYNLDVLLEEMVAEGFPNALINILKGRRP